MPKETRPRARARSSKPRGEYAKSATTRTVILDAALEVFAESGYRAGSLRDIAERSGMSGPGLLHHFPTKSALLQAVLDRRDTVSVEVIDFAAEDGVQTMRRVVEFIGHNSTTPHVVELYAILSGEATSADHPAHDYFVERYSNLRAATRSVFQRLAVEGRLAPGVDPERAAVMAIALIDGLQLQWLLDPSTVDMARELTVFLAGIIPGFEEGA